MKQQTESRICKRHGRQDYRRDGNGWRCPECKKDAVRRWRAKQKQKAVDYLGGKCIRCNYHKCIAALEFHHRDPSTKLFGISDGGQTRSWNRVKVELDKCGLLCANCHREVEAGL
jgi:hypothetical protein